MTWLSRAFWTLSALGGLYAVLLGALLKPEVQRFAVYANKINTLFKDDLYRPETFGFMKGQVVPFNITTPDGETLFAWHILPMDVYARHEAELKAEYEDAHTQYLQSLAFRLAHEDLDTKVVVNFHGNAGHLANGARQSSLRALSISSTAHIITFDYRGFGHSTGSPNEEGVITDGITIVNFVINELLVPSERVVLLSQSLGTGIATATALHFSDPQAALRLLPASASTVVHKTARPVGDFAAIILIAPFTSLAPLAKTYRLVGIVPFLSPLRFYPFLQDFLVNRIVESFNTQERITSLVRSSAARTGPSRYLRVHMIHATNDLEISHRYSRELLFTAANASHPRSGVTMGQFNSWQKEEVAQGRGGNLRWTWGPKGVLPSSYIGSGEVLLETLSVGGHNKITGFVNIPLAVHRAFERVDMASEA